MVATNYNVSIYKENEKNEYDVDEADDEPQGGICCLGGCITGCTFFVLLMLILPAGMLLIIYATNNKEYDVLAAGAILVAVPVIAVPVGVGIYLNRRRFRRFRKRKVRDKHSKQDTGNVRF